MTIFGRLGISLIVCQAAILAVNASVYSFFIYKRTELDFVNVSTEAIYFVASSCQMFIVDFQKDHFNNFLLTHDYPLKTFVFRAFNTSIKPHT